MRENVKVHSKSGNGFVFPKIDRSRPIGIFDSGLGGLTVVKAVRKLLPAEDIVYFGDIARLPYGIKSSDQIIACSKSNTEFLLNHRIKALVVACNSSASTSLDVLLSYYRLPLIIDVIRPAVAEALRRTRNGRIGLLGTQVTVRTKSYDKLIAKWDSSGHARIFSCAAPLLVPLVESGWLREEVTKTIMKCYLKTLLARKIDTLILGCTHYPLLKQTVRDCVGPGVEIIDAAPFVADELKKGLGEIALLKPVENARKGKLRIFLSDMPQDFQRIGEKFLGERLEYVKKVSWP